MAERNLTSISSRLVFYTTPTATPIEQSLFNLEDYSQSNDSFNLNTTFSSQPFEFSFTFQLCIYILYNTVFVTAVLGNILVIYVIASSPRMRTVTNYFIANLALGDLLMAVLCVPFSYIPVLSQYWPFGGLLCSLVSPAQAISVFISAYSLVALAIDRHMAILYPLRPRLRRPQALFVIGLIWAVAVLTTLPIALFTRLEVDPYRDVPLCDEFGWPDEEMKMGYSLTLMVLQYFFPISVLIFTYTRIVIAVWGKKAPGEFPDGRDQRLAKAKRKTVLMTLFVVVGYTLAWLPLNLFTLFFSTLDLPHIEYIFFSCHWLAMAHTTYNPIIYAWINIKFRSTFYQVLSNCFNWKKGGVAGGGRNGFNGCQYNGSNGRQRTLKSVIVTRSRGRTCGSLGNGNGNGPNNGEKIPIDRPRFL